MSVMNGQVGLKKISLVAGARPNFMKIAPIIRALQEDGGKFCFRLVHTGQHYDERMSDVFFQELGIPEPAVFLNSGGGTHAQQTAKVMIEFEADCIHYNPDLVIVVGDVNSTLACAIVAKKLQIPVAHVEAGLRSGDQTMPEEINRIATDSITDLFFVTEPSGTTNLLHEGKDESRIFYVGNVMIDNLFYQIDKLLKKENEQMETIQIKKRLSRYGVVTLHRPSNVDDSKVLLNLMSVLQEISEELPLIFPVHPRTRKQLHHLGYDFGGNILALQPLSYMEFLNLWMDASVVITDSGGLQEETTALGVPCVTLRDNTERPVTLTEGTNTLVSNDRGKIISAVRQAVEGRHHDGRRPRYWDGHAATRIVDILSQQCGTVF